jgi:hypothetical protein
MISGGYRGMVIAVGLFALLTGLGLALIPYSTGVEGASWSRPCSAAVVGAFAADTAVDASATEAPPRSGCPSSARPRLAIGLAFFGGAVAVFVVVARRSAPRPDDDLIDPTSPRSAGWF